MSNIQAIAFDLDGTLIHSLPDLAASVNQMRAHYGLAPLPESTIETYIGDGALELVHRALTGDRNGRDNERVDEAFALHRDYYYDHLTVHTTLYPHVSETLEKLYQKGIPLALVTNKPEKHAKNLLKHFNIAQYFTTIYGGDTLPVHKPDPAQILAAAKDMNVEPTTLLMVGDSPNDILSGKAAGAKTLLVTYGYADIPAMLAHPNTTPDYQAKQIDELLNYI